MSGPTVCSNPGRRTQGGRLPASCDGLNRFLLSPGVTCRNLVSWTLGRALRRLGADFEASHGYRPLLVKTFIEPPHTGVRLGASNGRFGGETGGRGRQGAGRAAAETRKAIYLYELELEWRAWLGVGPAPARCDRPLEPTEGLDEEQWAKHEFWGRALGGQPIDETTVGPCPAPGGGSAARLHCGGP